jgi:2-polyprenyl-6-methoxyphenol hydroxylase-like FAD-dependent oxidoreductase
VEQVGGSIAGLMCGIMLKNHGHGVTILEKAISDDRHGYDTGIKIGPDVLDFLSKHCHASREFTITCKAPIKFNIEGKPKPEHSQSMTSTNWSLFVSLLRANFDGITSKAVPTAPESDQGNSVVAYRHGAKVVDIEEVGSSLQVHFEDAINGGTHSMTSDLVIVADGSTSLLRKMLLPNVERKYAGYVSWRGTVQEEAVLDKETSRKYAGKFVFHRMYRNYILQ